MTALGSFSAPYIFGGGFRVMTTQIVATKLNGDLSLAMVETVRAGDPFVAENGSRLQTIAWCVLTLELSRFIVVGIANSVSTAERPMRIDLNLSVTPWLAVLLLFVLARVFDQGARMREDLDGTV